MTDCVSFQIKKAHSSGQRIFPQLLRYRALVVDDYGIMHGASTWENFIAEKTGLEVDGMMMNGRGAGDDGGLTLTLGGEIFQVSTI